MKRKGLLLVISGPSGCGKGTVCSALLEKNENMAVSVSATTRDMRPGETEGVSYFFKTREEFEEMIKNDQLLEYNCGYSGNYYGTPRKYVMDCLDEGKDVILEIEMNGAANVKKAFPDAVTVFLCPPSLEELHDRLVGRGRESLELIEERFREAKAEIARMKEYDYAVVNDQVPMAVKRIETILEAERCAVKRCGDLLNDLTK